MKTIYLAGGMKEEWRKAVINIFCTLGNSDDVYFYDPTKSGFNKPASYTLWDMLAIQDSDVLFGYMEKDNPSGIGLACEVGYALGLGKKVILVNGQPNNHYFDFVANTGCTVFNDLVDAVDCLAALCAF